MQNTHRPFLQGQFSESMIEKTMPAPRPPYIGLAQHGCEPKPINGISTAQAKEAFLGLRCRTTSFCGLRAMQRTTTNPSACNCNRGTADTNCLAPGIRLGRTNRRLARLGLSHTHNARCALRTLGCIRSGRSKGYLRHERQNRLGLVVQLKTDKRRASTIWHSRFRKRLIERVPHTPGRYHAAVYGLPSLDQHLLASYQRAAHRLSDKAKTFIQQIPYLH